MKTVCATVLVLLITSLLRGDIVTVSAKSGPWDPAANLAMPYGRSDQAAPASVAVLPGELLLVGNATGQARADLGGLGPYGPDGYVNNPWGADNGRDYTAGIHYPSRYVQSSSFPVFLLALLGTFATPNGTVVGTPFKIGSQSLRLTVPTGAARLLLGVEDDRYADNSGSYTVKVERIAILMTDFSPEMPDNPCKIEINPETGLPEMVCSDRWEVFKVKSTIDGSVEIELAPVTIETSSQPNGPWTPAPNTLQTPLGNGAIEVHVPVTLGQKCQFIRVNGRIP